MTIERVGSNGADSEFSIICKTCETEYSTNSNGEPFMAPEVLDSQVDRVMANVVAQEHDESFGGSHNIVVFGTTPNQRRKLIKMNVFGTIEKLLS